MARGQRSQAASATGLVLAALGAIILLNVVGLLHPLESLTGWVVRPIANTLRLRDTSAEHEKIRSLEHDIAVLKGQVAADQEAKSQNEALRAQLGFAQSGGYKLAEANIISEDPTNFQQVITIDRGSRGGISKGMTAVTGGLLIGRVIETTTDTAKVYLITDYNSAVPALDQQTRSSGLVRGTRGFGLALEMVQQTDKLHTGDTLITSGFGGDFPAGLVIGTVGEIKHRDPDVFQSAEITPAVDFRKLERVFIITGRQ